MLYQRWYPTLCGHWICLQGKVRYNVVKQPLEANVATTLHQRMLSVTMLPQPCINVGCHCTMLPQRCNKLGNEYCNLPTFVSKLVATLWQHCTITVATL